MYGAASISTTASNYEESVSVAASDAPYVDLGQRPAWNVNTQQYQPRVRQFENVTVYEYRNQAAPSYTSYLIECRGLVSFQSRSQVTEWHGQFQSNGHCVRILFDCRGRRPWKSVFLFETERDRVWQGWDYLRRRITLVRLEAWEYDVLWRRWERVQGFHEVRQRGQQCHCC